MAFALLSNRALKKKLYRLNNADSIADYKKQYYLLHKEEIAAKARKWNQQRTAVNMKDGSVKMLTKRQIYRRKHPQLISKWSKSYYDRVQGPQKKLARLIYKDLLNLL